MERYDNLELDLECDGGGGGGGVAQRASLFGGMFKKSTKSNTEHGLSVHSQDSLSMNTELLNGNDSLTDDNNFKTSLWVTSPELSNSTDGLTETKSPKDKAGGLGAPPRLPPRPEHLGRASQDNLYFDPNSNSDNQTENTAAKESSGVFGMFKKSPKPSRRPSQDNMSNSSESSQDSLTVHSTKEGGGVFGGMFKKSPKIFTRTQSQDDLSDPAEFSQSENTKEKGGLFRGVFKKPKGAKAHSQEDLTAELCGSKEELSDNNSTKGNEKSGLLSGVFKKPKLGARSQSKDDLTADGESSDQQENLTENNTKEKSGILSGVFKKPKLAKSQSKEDLTADGELSNSQENLTENITKSGILSGVFKKPKFAKSQSKEDLTADGELPNSQENLADSNAKEKSGILSGVFKKPKFARSQSKDELNADAELSNSQENLTENNTKEKSVFFGGVFKKQKGLGSKSQSQDDLSENTEHSGSSENLAEKPSKGGGSNFLKNPFTSSAQKDDKVPKSSTSSEKTTAKWEKGSDSDSEENGETQHSAKPSKFAGAMTKLNPFRSGHKYEKSLDLSDEEEKEEIDKPKEQKRKDAEEKQEVAQSNEKQKEAKPKTVKNLVMEFEPRDRSEAILVTQAKDEVNKEMVSKEKSRTAETPRVPPRHTRQEMDKVKEPSQNPEETVAKHGGLYPTLPNKPDGETPSAEKPTEDNEGDKKPVKVRRTKHHNPFMPRTGVKLAAVETAEEAKEEENVETSTQKEENKDEEGAPKAEEKAKKPKRRNPFMPQVKNKVGQRRAEEGENEGANRSLFDQLEEFRFEPSAPESSEDADNLMEWWNTVENWEDTPQNEDMTPKEEAKAFAVTADKIQKGIRVFNKLFSERAESLWQHVIDLNGIADGLDKFNKKTKIAQITGGSTSATGGVLTIAGLALAPVTMGTSLIVTAVGLGVATAGGLTSAGAGISNQVNNSMDRKKVEKIVEDYQEKMVDLNKALIFIKQGIEHLRRFDLIKIKKQAYNRDFPVLNSRFYEDGAMAGKAILVNANEIMRVVQIANVAGSTAARAVQIASMATGVLTGLFVGMDIYFVAKDSKELKKGAKSEFAAKIREVAQQLHDGLVELNTIREELQSTSAPQEEEGGGGEGEEKEKEKKKDEYDDDEEEDEIDRIKKQIKKDYENREWV